MPSNSVLTGASQRLVSACILPDLRHTVHRRVRLFTLVYGTIAANCTLFFHQYRDRCFSHKDNRHGTIFLFFGCRLGFDPQSSPNESQCAKRRQKCLIPFIFVATVKTDSVLLCEQTTQDLLFIAFENHIITSTLNLTQ